MAELAGEILLCDKTFLTLQLRVCLDCSFSISNFFFSESCDRLNYNICTIIQMKIRAYMLKEGV